MTDGWKPIESAPRNGSEVLLFSPDARDNIPIVGLWSSGELPNGLFYGDWVDCWSDAVIDAEPTHWMLLPEPPKPTPND